MLKFLSLLLFCLCGLLTFKNVAAQDVKPYTVYLKEGTLLKKLSDKSQVTLSKGIYAKVLELNPKRRNRFYVYDNNGIAVYETSALGVVEIADDIRLLPDVDAEKIYPAKSIFKATNQFALFDSQVSVHFDNLGVSSFNSVYSDEITTVLSTRYEVRTLYVSDLPFKFGFGLNYQSAYWQNDFEQVKLSILSFGPHFKYNLYTSDRFNLQWTLGAELAPIYQGTTEYFTDKYSAQLYDLGLESEWKSPLGILSLGSHFRHHEVALSESDRVNLTLTPKELSVNSLGVMLGYKIEWEL